MVWVGGGVVLGALALRVVRAGDPEEMARFSAGLRAIGPVVLAPSWGYWLIVLLLVAATWDMVFKPGL
jgi:hypothetical protein